MNQHMRNGLFNFFLFLIIGCNTGTYAQLSQIGSGWAKNSVNAVIFRKNSVVSFEGIQYAAFYDSTGHVVLARRDLGSTNWEIKQTPYTGNINDAHCSISIMVDGEGYLHMAWNHHNNPLHYCRSIRPGSLQLTGKLSMVGSYEDLVSYPEFHKLPSGDLLFFYRHGESGNGNLVVNRYSPSKKSWKRVHDLLIDGEGQRNAYWQTFVDNKGSIHLSWVWRESWDVATNHDICYAKSKDGGISWQNSEGKEYALPITATTAEYACIIPQRSELINQTSMYADSYGRPYIVSYWRPVGTDIPQYRMVYLDDEGWKMKQVSKRKTPFSLSGGGTKKIPVSRPQIMIDDTNDSVKVYIVYRDKERGNKVSLNFSPDINNDVWLVYDLTNFPVDSWEPSYDTELWKESMILHLFVERVGQGDEEGIEDLTSQPVYILEVPATIHPVDTVTMDSGGNDSISE
ncbi:hypothetical protein ES705_37649 [subsurface metagenome]